MSDGLLELAVTPRVSLSFEAPELIPESGTTWLDGLPEKVS